MNGSSVVSHLLMNRRRSRSPVAASSSISLKQVPLRLVHGDHCEALVPVPVIRREAENRIHDRLRLAPVPVIVVNAAVDPNGN